MLNLLRKPVKAAVANYRLFRRRLRRLGWGLIPHRWRWHTEVVTDFSYHRYLRELVNELSDLLTSAGIEHLILDSRLLDQPQLVVEVGDRAQVLRSLRTSPQTASWWFAVVRSDVTGRSRPAHVPRLGGSASALLVNRNMVTAEGIELVDESYGALISFWTRLASATPTTGGGVLTPGTIMAPKPTGVLDWIEPELWQQVQAQGHRMAPELPHLLLVNEPVDVVYTWVDGDDPAWQARKSKAGLMEDDLPLDAGAEVRFNSHDELRYSLRSLQFFADWVNRIWIVTDQQVPSWLQQDSRLHVVDHQDIFSDPSALPVFNSHAIESQLHHIPGLASHYVYLNDDIMFARPVNPELFFHGDRLLKFFPSPRLIDPGVPSAEDRAVAVAGKNNRDFIRTRFGKNITAKLRHTPHAQLREVMTEFEEREPELFAQISRSQLRSSTDYALCSSLGQYYAYATGRAITGKINHGYMETSRSGAHYAFEDWLIRHELQSICLNDSESDDAAAARRGAAILQDFLDSAFPLPSRWEKTS